MSRKSQKAFLGFTDIVTTATGYVSVMSSGPKVTYVGSEATAIADAFRIFVKVQASIPACSV